MEQTVVTAAEIEKQTSLLVQQANRFLPDDVLLSLETARKEEPDPGARLILDIVLENAALSARTGLPICQDTGIDVVFIEKGPDCLIEGDLAAAVNRGIAQGTAAGFLRNSVCDPVTRKNTGNNTPAVIHLSMSPEPGLKLSVLPKGCGSENMSALKMLPPSAGLQGAADFVVECVLAAGPNPCPPGVIGVGIGGTMEQAALLSKKALLRPAGRPSPRSDLAELESLLLQRIKGLGIGPQGLGGETTALAVAMEAFPCHIASLPVSVNIQCHAARRAEARYLKGRWERLTRAEATQSGASGALSSLLRLARPLELPLTRQKAAGLKAGDWVKISGRLFTGRDQTHKRICALLDRGSPLPVNLEGALIYYVGPSPAPPGYVIGSAGPTTSYRMDAYTPRILAEGVLGMMGKGRRSPEVVHAIKERGAVYLATIGGAGAFLSGCIKKCSVAAFEDLGPEALYELEVEDFPAIVINDPRGRDYYQITGSA